MSRTRLRLPAAITGAPVVRVIGPSHDDAAGEGEREGQGNQDNAQATHGDSFRDGPRRQPEAFSKLAHERTQRNGTVAFYFAYGKPNPRPGVRALDLAIPCAGLGKSIGALR